VIDKCRRRIDALPRSFASASVLVNPFANAWVSVGQRSAYSYWLGRGERRVNLCLKLRGTGAGTYAADSDPGVRWITVSSSVVDFRDPRDGKETVHTFLEGSEF